MLEEDVTGPRWARVDSGLTAVERAGEIDVVWVGTDNSLSGYKLLFTLTYVYFYKKRST